MLRDDICSLSNVIKQRGLAGITLFLICLFFCVEVRAEHDEGFNLASRDKNVSINITSDQLEVYTNDNLVVFTGNVVARQGDMSTYSDRMSVYYRENKSEGDVEEKDAAEIDRIVAEGHVKIVKGNRIAIGQKAVFLSADQEMTLTGNPRIWQGKNIIKGDKIILYLKQNRCTIERGQDRRVEATIYPETEE